MFTRLRDYRVVPIVRYKYLSENDAVCIAEALIAAGLPVMEIVFRRHSDYLAIKRIAGRFPDFLVGAGDIINTDQLLRVFDANAKFAVAPGANNDTIDVASKINLPFAPGACTPTEVEKVVLAGAVDFQFFPAETIGGVAMLEQILSAFDHLPIDIYAKGNISFDKMTNYLQISKVSAVAVDWIVKNEYIKDKNWRAITDAALRAVQEVRQMN